MPPTQTTPVITDTNKPSVHDASTGFSDLKPFFFNDYQAKPSYVYIGPIIAVLIIATLGIWYLRIWLLKRKISATLNMKDEFRFFVEIKNLHSSFLTTDFSVNNLKSFYFQLGALIKTYISHKSGYLVASKTAIEIKQAIPTIHHIFITRLNDAYKKLEQPSEEKTAKIAAYLEELCVFLEQIEKQSFAPNITFNLEEPVSIQTENYINTYNNLLKKTESLVTQLENDLR